MHVRTETRKVYVSVRGTKLSKHAAYIAAAKEMIAQKCAALEKAHAKTLGNPDASDFAHAWEALFCNKDGPWQCRFHKWHDPRPVYLGHGEWDEVGGGMEHYAKVLPRLVRFLKFVDARRQP